MTENHNIAEQIKKLVQLQNLDTEIFDLKAKKETFPERIKEMDESLNSKKGGMESAEEELKNLQVAKNEKETDMKPGRGRAPWTRNRYYLFFAYNISEWFLPRGSASSARAPAACAAGGHARYMKGTGQ